MIKRVTPTKSYLIGYEDKLEELTRLLSYESLQEKFQAERFSRANWYIRKYGEQAHRNKLNSMRMNVNKTLLFRDSIGYYTLSGLEKRIAEHFNDQIVNEVIYPENRIIPWSVVPEFEDRYYQKIATQNLIKEKHASIELVTGSGKSKIILDLVKNHGLKTLLMVPTLSIALQMFELLSRYLGKDKVGLFGDGTKKTEKLVVVGIAASLARLKPDSPHYKNILKSKVFIVDESHLTPANTLERICMELAADIPYRYFVSGTQMRGDGKDLVLEGIIGPIVYSLDLKQAVDEGFLAKPRFVVVNSNSNSMFFGGDPLEMMNKHFYNNKYLHKQAALLADKLVSAGKKVLILIEHIEQFQYIFPYLKNECKFAHAGVDEHLKNVIPEKYHKSDPTCIVKQFNDGLINLMCGTSCVSIGTDFRPVNTIIYLQGGRSEAHIRQAIGRGTRKVSGKTDFLFIDFYVGAAIETNVERHCTFRCQLYETLYAKPDVWDFKI